MASITSSGHCVPPGPSKNASRRSSAEKRARTAPMSSSVALTEPQATRPESSENLLAVDDPAMTRPRGQRIRDEAAVLGLGDELIQRARIWGGREIDLERRLDGDERVQAVVPPRHDAVRAPDAERVETGPPRCVVHARE